MKKLFFSCFLLILSINLASQIVHIDSVLHCLEDKNLAIDEILGEMVFISSDYENNIFESKYILANNNKGIDSICFIKSSTQNLLSLNKQVFSLENDYDVTTCRFYSVKSKDDEFICLLGKSSSASGSGLQITFYSIFQKQKKRYKKIKEFYSRFGKIENIGDFNNDGYLDYLCIKHENKNFKLFISNMDGFPLNDEYFILEYIGDDKFVIISNSLRRTQSCW